VPRGLFWQFWKEHYPNIIVRRPTADICDDCYVFYNRVKYSKRSQQSPIGAGTNSNILDDGDDDEDEEEEEEEASMTEVEQYLKDQTGTIQVTNTGIELYDKKKHSAKSLEQQLQLQDNDTMDQLLLKAAKHVQHALEMRDFANEKIKNAVDCHALPDSVKNGIVFQYTDTIICDYCQNMGLPQLGEHQAGATYYYSPLTINCFGIADVTLKEPKLTAYIYHEGEGKKGGNNVASLIMKHIIDKGWNVPHRGEELNIIMDNCAGQNKNRMVLRIAPLLIELNWYYKVNMIFLVAGHTKNAADRLFNLLKKEYRKTNIYNMEQLQAKLSEHRLVEAVKVGVDDFYDFDEYLNKIYNQVPTGAIKQYQYFKAYFLKQGWLQAQVSCPDVSAGVIFDLNRTTANNDAEQRKILIKNFALNSLCLTNLKPPGIHPIKQVEMFSKWRQFVLVIHITDIYAEPEKEVMQGVTDDWNKKVVAKKASSATAKTAITKEKKLSHLHQHGKNNRKNDQRKLPDANNKQNGRNVEQSGSNCRERTFRW
jgi:hypothetical protein